MTLCGQLLQEHGRQCSLTASERLDGWHAWAARRGALWSDKVYAERLAQWQARNSRRPAVDPQPGPALKRRRPSARDAWAADAAQGLQHLPEAPLPEAPLADRVMHQALQALEDMERNELDERWVLWQRWMRLCPL